MIHCRRMNRASRPAALTLLRAFLNEDEYYLDSSSAYGGEAGEGGDAALERALDLFLAWPELGMVWLAYDGEEPVAVCVVCFAISTSAGGLVAKLDDVFVAEGKRGQGVGSTHLSALQEELRRMRVRRIDTSVHLGNDGARRFYKRHGFQPLGEERLAFLL
jgi:GNAT superfamily N-acetyltransferase